MPRSEARGRVALKDLGSRIVFTALALTILVTLILFAMHPWVRWGVFGITGLLAVVAVKEYEQLAKAKGGKVMYFALAPLSVLIVFSFFAKSQFNTVENLSLISVLVAVWFLFALHFRRREGAVVDLAVSLFGLFYISVPLGMILSILYLPGGEDGRLWFTYLIAVTKITDISAYFVGSLWGKRKLAPLISPGKTVEGAIFGWIAAVLMSLLFFFLGNIWQEKSFHLSLSTSLWLGALLGLASQFGDLSESLLKRDAEKKDSNTLPGIGGVLDLVDSLLFNAPILYLCIL